MTPQDISRALRHASQGAPFSALALTLYVFCHRLDRRARAAGSEHLYFLAREGKILQELFNRYQAHLAPADRLETSYLQVSRRSTHVLRLRAIDDEDFSALLALYPGLSGRPFLHSLGFDDPAAETIVRATSTDDPSIDQLTAAPVFRDRYEERRREQRRLLVQYLEQEGATGRGCLDLVDVGWKGTMQDQLAGAAPGSATRGWYVGLTTETEAGDAQRNGLIFSLAPEISPHYRVFGHFKSVYELLLNAGHGSVAGYEDGPAGAACPVFDERAEEHNSYEHSIKPFQSSLVATFERLAAELSGDFVDTARSFECVARHHARMVWMPTRSEVHLIDEIRHYENFGPFEVVEIGQGVGSQSRLGAMLTLIRRPAHFLNAAWPPLRLERAGLRVASTLIGATRWCKEFVLPRVWRLPSTWSGRR